MMVTSHVAAIYPCTLFRKGEGGGIHLIESNGSELRVVTGIDLCFIIFYFERRRLKHIYKIKNLL